MSDRAIPSDEEIVAKLSALRVELGHEIGLKKLHVQMRDTENWAISIEVRLIDFLLPIRSLSRSPCFEQRLKKLATVDLRTAGTALYAVRPTKDSGLGAFATQHIPAGTCVCKEAPLFIAPLARVADAVAQLDPSALKAMRSLTANGKGSTQDERIFQGNAYIWTRSSEGVPLTAAVSSPSSSETNLIDSDSSIAIYRDGITPARPIALINLFTTKCKALSTLLLPFQSELRCSPLIASDFSKRLNVGRL